MANPEEMARMDLQAVQAHPVHKGREEKSANKVHKGSADHQELASRESKELVDLPVSQALPARTDRRARQDRLDSPDKQDSRERGDLEGSPVKGVLLDKMEKQVGYISNIINRLNNLC